MATSMVLKRSSRLDTRDLSAKAVPRLRSRKVITPNEDSPKVKVATRIKPLCVITEDVSPIKYKSTKLHKGSFSEKSSKMKKVKKVKKSLVEKEQEEKKTPKRRKNVVISSNINTNKPRIPTKERKVTNNSTKQRQMSLEESFKHQSLSKRLRPRRNKVNYCDDSKLLQQHLPSKHQDSVVMLERVDSDDTIKVPVYKTTKTLEPSLEDKNNIYDFKYDVNDTKEKLAKKKKKKRNVKIKSKKIKKNVHKKDTVEVKTVDDGADKSDSDTDYPVENAQCKSTVESAAAPIPLPKPTKEDVIEVSKVDASVHIVEETSLSDKPSNQSSAEQSEKQDVRCKEVKMQDIKKPRIVSIENADNISVVKAVPGSNQDILPFRPSSNILNTRPTVQYRNTSNSSLLIKSLSPILKDYDTFDPGSPWRPPQLPYMFSRAKHFIQSTPNLIKMDTIHKKRLIQVKDDSCNADKVANVSDIMSKNANSPVQNISDNKVGYKKNPNSCRKFGTEITNIDHLSNCSTIQVNNIEVISEKQLETETNAVTNVPLDTIALPSPNPPSSFDDTDDKENVAANYQTPKKSTKKKLKKRHFSNFSPLKTCENKSTTQSENVDPQPGPSGTRDAKNCDEQKIFRQSNLNNFLNLMDMPENSRISTKHGIFDDAHSSPVNSSAIKKSTKPTIGELKNAFGFCESELDSSPSKSELATNQASNNIWPTCASKPLATPTPARLSLRELRNNLIQKKPNKNADCQQTTKQKDVEVSKPPKVKKNNRLVDVVDFSDTFDVLSESGRLSSCDVPLFVDLEPSHFSKPAQHSYKRKRVVTFDFSDDSGKDEEKDEEENVKKLTKKKKLTKLERENKKRLNEWVKTVNDTFQEIDDYDLLIE